MRSQKIVLQGQLTDLGVQRLHVHSRLHPPPRPGPSEEKGHRLDFVDHQSLRAAVQALRAVVGRSDILALRGRLIRKLCDRRDYGNRHQQVSELHGFTRSSRPAKSSPFDIPSERALSWWAQYLLGALCAPGTAMRRYGYENSGLEAHSGPVIDVAEAGRSVSYRRVMDQEEMGILRGAAASNR
jgi:hypothetical protein